jgi:hypothetical protein
MEVRDLVVYIYKKIGGKLTKVLRNQNTWASVTTKKSQYPGLLQQSMDKKIPGASVTTGGMRATACPAAAATACGSGTVLGQA